MRHGSQQFGAAVYVIYSALCISDAPLLAETPLIPRAVLLGNPDHSDPRISPDGKRLAYLAPEEGVLNVWMRTVGQHDDRTITKARRRGIEKYFWAPDNKQIIYVLDKRGDDNRRVYCVDVETLGEKDLTPFDGVQPKIVSVNPKFPNEILVAINQRDPQFFDVFRVNIDTGKSAMVLKNSHGFIGFDADYDFRVRAAMRMTPNGGTELLVRDDEESDWRPLTHWEQEDILRSGSIAFTPDGAGLYIVTSTGSETKELRQIDVATGKEQRLASNRSADLAGIFMHPVKHTIQAVSFNKERLHWRVLDRDIKKDFAAIRRVRRGDYSIIHRDHIDKTWLVAFTTDDGPVHYYVYDREQKKAELLFTNRTALEGMRLAKMEPISFQSNDGLTIHGYLTTPRGVRPRKLPTVLKVHNGPWRRDSWGYDGETQWLANRGYAVLQINFRGSTGYGKSFVNAADREWGGRMQQDLLDGVNWAVRQGIADPKRIAIFGAGYGGYAALMGLAFTPDVFACGVDIAGPTNLITFMENIPAYWKPLERILWDRIGHPQRDAEFLRSRSPLFSAERITKPLLIAQGANVGSVRLDEVHQLVETLRAGGKSVEYAEYPNEGRDFSLPENRLDFFARAEKFLAQHIGGRYEK